MHASVHTRSYSKGKGKEKDVMSGAVMTKTQHAVQAGSACSHSTKGMVPYVSMLQCKTRFTRAAFMRPYHVR